MKILAYYLPQYHQVEENDEWWGKGFTEWTNIKKAKTLYKNHEQPLKPLDNNYYDLSEKKTLDWQAKLARKYGVEGFCFYHYWFNGRKILEKPAENLLNWNDIDINFCFCWANHSWRKTWNGTMEMLIEQTYSLEDEWEDHFSYLLKFFKDKRYIKINERPVLVLYSAKDIPNLSKRIDYYNNKAIENGFKGIYIIESINSVMSREISKKSLGITLREPSIFFAGMNLFNKIIHEIKRGFRKNYLYFPAKYKFNSLISKSIKYSEEYKTDKTIFLGSFTAWDSTPRHGRRGYVIESTPKLFKEYLLKQKRIIENKEGVSEYIFLNAWNEWAEGMYLEPDEKNKYGYLEAIREVVNSK